MEGGAVGRQRRIDAGRGVRGTGRGQRLEGARVGRAVEVELAVAAEAGEAGVGEPVRSDGGRERAGLLEPGQLHGREVRGLQAAGPGRGGGEAAGDEVGSELDRLEQLAADIARDGRDAHAREHLAQPGVEGGEHVRDRGLRRDLLRAARAGLLADELEQQARVDDARAGGDDHREAVHVEHVAGVDREVGASAQPRLGERGVDGARGEHGRDGETPLVERRGGIGQDDDLGTVPRRVEGLRAQPVERVLEAGGPGAGRPRRVERADGPVRGPGADADGVEQPLEVDDDRAADADGRGTHGHPAQQRRAPAELHLEVHHRALALGVDRRVGDLRERLPEVVGDRPRDAATAGERRVVAHAPQGLVGVEGHGAHVEPQLLGVEPEQVSEGRRGRTGRDGGLRARDRGTHDGRGR